MIVPIRTAEAQDADFLSWAILTAARSHREKGWFDLVVDQPEEGCLRYLRRLTLAETRSWWHWSRFHPVCAGSNAASDVSMTVSEGERAASPGPGP